MDGLYHAILDRRQLQQLQNEFCMTAGVYAFCIDDSGIDMTEMSGDEQDKAVLVQHVSREQMLSLFHRVSESSLEDQAIEETECDALKYAVVCTKEEGRTVLAWLVCAVLSDAESQEGREFAQGFHYQTTERRFNKALDLLREISRDRKSVV